MKCSVCGVVNRSDAQFCSRCGSSLSSNECPKCKAQVEPDARFCSSCGARISESADGAGKTCQSCGFINPRDTVYCKRCMQKIL